MPSLRTAKKVYDIMKNDHIRAISLLMAEKLGIRKNVIRMDTNDVCNIECIMCSNRLKKITPENIMPFEDFKLIIDKLAPQARYLYLACSYEPLVTPHFEKYAEYAKKAGIPFVSLCTNGLLLSEKIIKSLIDNRIDEIIISFNGFNADDYNRIMHRSNYEIVIRNLCKLKEYKKEINSAYPKVRLNSILMKSNVTHFNEIVKFINTYNIETVQFREMKVRDTANNYEEVCREELGNIADQDFIRIVHAMKDKTLELRGTGKNIMLPKSLVQNSELARKKESTYKKGCTIPYFSYWIDHQGYIKNCLYSNNSICNLKTENLSDNKRKIKMLREDALNGHCSIACSNNVDSSDFL